jgi:hypothetical protein
MILSRTICPSPYFFSSLPRNLPKSLMKVHYGFAKGKLPERVGRKVSGLQLIARAAGLPNHAGFISSG